MAYNKFFRRCANCRDKIYGKERLCSKCKTMLYGNPPRREHERETQWNHEQQ